MKLSILIILVLNIIYIPVLSDVIDTQFFNDVLSDQSESFASEDKIWETQCLKKSKRYLIFKNIKKLNNETEPVMVSVKIYFGTQTCQNGSELFLSQNDILYGMYPIKYFKKSSRDSSDLNYENFDIIFQENFCPPIKSETYHNHSIKLSISKDENVLKFDQQEEKGPKNLAAYGIFNKDFFSNSDVVYFRNALTKLLEQDNFVLKMNKMSNPQNIQLRKISYACEYSPPSVDYSKEDARKDSKETLLRVLKTSP